MQSFTDLCAKFHTILCKKIAIVNLSIVVLKSICNYKAFSAKLHAHEMFGSREFITVFRVAPKSICGPLI